MTRTAVAVQALGSGGAVPITTARSPGLRVESAILVPFLGSVSPGGMRRIRVRSVVVTETSSPLSPFKDSWFASGLTAVTVPESLARFAAGGVWARTEAAAADARRAAMAV